MKTGLLVLVSVMLYLPVYAGKLFIPMDSAQTNHLKAYGVVYSTIADGNEVEWLLNYKGGSFAMDYSHTLEDACKNRAVTYERLSNTEYLTMMREIASSMSDKAVVLGRVPKIAVYTPTGKPPWDDAVTLALTYAEIPFDKLYVDEVLAGRLSQYDWLHLHHEDFTGQYGKFWSMYKNEEWYRAEKRSAEKLAASHGFKKVWQMQLAVVKTIKRFVGNGGNLFAMCSATDTYDISLAANGIDICDTPYDGDKMDPSAQSLLEYDSCFAFTGFTVSDNPFEYEYATIDNVSYRFLPESADSFSLRKFDAGDNPVAAMLCQNHTNTIKGFMGQTTSFRREVVKPNVLILAENTQAKEVRYMHGNYKKGSWTFYSGHDPEDYQHMVGEAPTNLEQHPNSPGYRLILNNVLYMASGKREHPAKQTPIIDTQQVAEEPEPTPKDQIHITAGGSANTLVISIGKKNEADDDMLIRQVALVNAAGKEVFRKQYNARTATVYMDDLEPGIYSVLVNDTNAGKVVKN